MGATERRVFFRFLLLIILIESGSSEDSTLEEIESFPNSGQTGNRALVPSRVRESRRYRYGDRRGNDEKYQDDHDDEDHQDSEENGEMKAVGQSKYDYWNGYYDFLINEGSYKFWAVFQLATAALLIYSGFAALYYAKVNPPTSDDDFDDIFRRRRRRFAPAASATDRPYSGLDSVTFQRILDAVERDAH